MYVYTYSYVYASVHVYVCVYVSISLCVHYICKFEYIYIYACVFAYMHVIIMYLLWTFRIFHITGMLRDLQLKIHSRLTFISHKCIIISFFNT